MSTTPTNPTPDRTDAALTEARADVKAEITRTDTKASLLIAFNGAVLAGLGTALPRLSLGAPALIAGAAVLLGVIRPRLGACPGTFPHWATLTTETLRADMAHDRRPEAVVALSRVALAKYTGLRRAVDITRAAGVLLVVAAVLAVIGGAA
ncbi:Pycsar system effector family protein [Streptomyces sp. TRM 70351]|uniref:Pycsar system effector family protein n=1 Tax=Streptomyces sp. TRM 70351 TaxID=3116552 RepID=UPI002E7B45D4|nr:Pycsar system effector family protein [Streptomyces sp. TRM 70351]MEE1929841.1 Pycsar system effector family protein [Streptomyces sp. TRM 70351]